MDNRGVAATAYLETAVKKMLDRKESIIPCPCLRCENTLMFDPFRGTLLSHLLKSGFMEGYELVPDDQGDDEINENMPDVEEWPSLDDEEEGGNIDVDNDHDDDVGPEEDEMGTQSSLQQSWMTHIFKRCFVRRRLMNVLRVGRQRSCSNCR